jgi:hypothetical protein
VAGDRVLVKDQTAAAQNGIYEAASGSWARSGDADTSAKVTAGMFTFISEGTVNGDNAFALTTNDPITLGTTALVFTQVSGAGQVVAGTGLSKSGNTLSVSFGTSGSTACAGDDSRLSNARQMAAATANVDCNTHKVVNVVDPTADQDAATKGYTDKGDATGKQVWLDVVNGNNSTGARGKANLPFLTPQAAKAAASSGDTIMVRPGNYSGAADAVANLLKAGVNWHFIGACSFDAAGNAPMFDDSSAGANAAIVCQITGWPKLINDSQEILKITNAGSDVYLEARHINIVAGAQPAIRVTAGKLTIRLRRAQVDSVAAILKIEGGTVRFEIDEGTSAGVGIEIRGGTVIGRGDSIAAAGIGVNVVADGSITADLSLREIKSTGNYGCYYLEDSAALVTLNGTRLISTLGTTGGIAVLADGQNLTLKDCVLVSNTSGTPATASISSTGASNVRIYGTTMANLAKGSDITFITNSAGFIVDADVR